MYNVKLIVVCLVRLFFTIDYIIVFSQFVISIVKMTKSNYCMICCVRMITKKVIKSYKDYKIFLPPQKKKNNYKKIEQTSRPSSTCVGLHENILELMHLHFNISCTNSHYEWHKMQTYIVMSLNLQLINPGPYPPNIWAEK